MLVKKITLAVVSVAMAFGLSGCQEVDGTGDVKPKQPSVIVQNLDLSEVSAPSEVYIYSAEYWDWEAETETVLDVFLDGVYDEKANWATGDQYLFKLDSKKEKILNIYDGGRSYFGERRHPGEEAGFSYGLAPDTFHLGDLFPEYVEITLEYSNSRKIYSQDLDEGEEAFVAAKEEVEDYLEKVHMEHYTVHEAAMLQGKKPKDKGLIIYWRQTIDEIPISDVFFTSSAIIEDTRIYNAKLDYDREMLQPSSTLETKFLNGELVDFSATNVIRAKDKLKKYPVISVSEAYEKVEEQYQNYTSGISAPTLETAELQYKMVELDEKVYLYPIWTFCVKTEEDDVVAGKTEILWNYYLIDAVSGEYFTGIDVGEIEGNSGLTR